jgi:hypothetical protein
MIEHRFGAKRKENWRAAILRGATVPAAGSRAVPVRVGNWRRDAARTRRRGRLHYGGNLVLAIV